MATVVTAGETRSSRATVDPARRSVPIRTCVGCRGRAVLTDLLRVVVVESVLVPDPRRRLPGRGAHVHLDLQCLDTAIRRQAFRRALRLAFSPGVDQVRAHLEGLGSQQLQPPFGSGFA